MMYWGGGGVVARDSPCYHRLQYDLANSYYWSGQQCVDLVYFYMQWHPILGLFLSHPNHPWSKRERVVQLVVSMLFSLPATAAMAAITTSEDFPMLAKISNKVLALVLITIPNCLGGVLLYQFSVAGAACPQCKCLFRCLHNCCVLVMLALAFVGCTFSLIFLLSEPNLVDPFRPLFNGLMLYWLLWFPLWLFVPCQLGFCSLWNVESEKARSLLESA